MLTSCFKPILEKCCGQEQHGGDKDELLWHLDLKPHASGEFSIAVVQANNTLEDQSQVVSSPSFTYIGVYDGHGGPDASRFITHHLFPHLQKLAAEQGGISAEVIKRAFEVTEQEFLRKVKNTWITQPHIVNVGSCCLVGVICGDVLYVANLGDSRAVLGRRTSDRKRGPVVAERLTTDHNVAVEEVRKEVEALHPDDAHVVVFTRGVWRIKGIIQVSRSIGDVYLKKPEYHKDPLFQQFAPPVFLKRAVMTAEPSIQIRKLRPQDLFLIFASDGLWEQLSDEEVVDMVVKSPRSGIAKRLVRAALKVAVKKRDKTYEVVKSYGKGDRRNYHDDITVIVIYLDHHSGTQKGGFDIFKETNSPRDIYTQNMDDADDRPLNPTAQ